MSSSDQTGAQPSSSVPPSPPVGSQPEPICVESISYAAPAHYWHPVPMQRTTVTFNPSDPGHTAARVAQPPQNYSSSQEGTSVANSHTPYNIRIEQERIKREKEINRAKQATSNLKQDDDEEATRTMTTTDEGSFFSYHSTRDLSTFLREANGRMFNNQSDLYMLPSDDDEFQRLAKQHYSMALCMGGLTPCPELVDEILDPQRHTDPTLPAGILDLGCGSGIWAMEMALKYPHASVVGVDLAPVAFDQTTIPGNVRFEIDDITLGLSHYYNRFNVVQVRCITGGIPNYRLMMHDVEACLRPGGVVIFIDGDTLMHGDDCLTPVPAAVDEDEPGGPIEGSWFQRLARETRFASIYQGVDTPGAEDEIMAGLWDHDLIDPESVHVAGLFTPIGPWPTSSDIHQQQKIRYAGSLMRQDCIRMIRAWHPLLKKHGIPADVVDKWTERADDELEKMKYRMSLHWMITWGRKRIVEDSGSPPSTRGSSPFSNEDNEQQQQPQQAESSSIPAPAPVSAPTPTAVPTPVPAPAAAPTPVPVPAVGSTSAAPIHSADINITATATNHPPAPVVGFQTLQIRASKQEAHQVARIHLEGLCSLPNPMINQLREARGLDVFVDEVEDGF